MNKKHKKKGKAKSRNSSEKRSKSLSKKSKESKTAHTSRKSSFTGIESANAGDDHSVREEKNISTLTKPQKLEKASMSMWSEPSRCCVCCVDRSTVQPCKCKEVNNAFPQFIQEQPEKYRTEDQVQATVCIGLLTRERDHYKAEFERLLELFEKLNDSNEDQGRNRLQCRACEKKDQIIEYFQRENQILAKEKFIMMTRLEEGSNKLDMQSPGGTCQKLPCKRMERERDMLKFDVQRLEEENDCLREKIKVTNENKMREYVKFQEYRIEYENTISKLDGERRELIKAQGIRRITINALEEKVQTYTDLLKAEQDETQRIRNQYFQLKKLHDQCDKALLDTQAQLLEVETELLNCQNKISTGINETVKTMPEQRTMREVTTAKRPEEIALEEQNTKLKNELSEMKKELNSWKECSKNNEKLLLEKMTEMKNLQDENYVKLSQLKELQSNLEERDSVSRVLHAEVDHLNKETNALVNTNQKQLGDIQQYKVQVSVAMERINELENKVKKLEGTIKEYEKQIRVMKNNLDKFESQTALKDKEMDQLLQCKLTLEKTKEQLDIQTEENKRKICNLECQCQKLKMNLINESSKDNIISELNSKLAEMKAGREILDKENAELIKKATKMENKLFQCICTICDNPQDKCTMLRCFLNENGNPTFGGGTFVNVTVGGKDVATQVCICEGRCRKSRGSANSKMLDMTSIDKTRSKDDIAYPTYGSTGPGGVGQGIPFYAKEPLAELEDQILNTTPPFNFEDSKSVVTENDIMLSSVPELQSTFINSTPFYPSEIVKEFITDEYVMAYKRNQKDNGEQVSRND